MAKLPVIGKRMWLVTTVPFTRSSHFPVGDLREETGAKGVSKVDVVEAIRRNDDVVEGQRALVRVGHVDDCAPGGAHRLGQPLREPIRAIGA